MRVLLTGATGFVGGHLLQALLAQGARVRCLVRPTSPRRNLEGLTVDLAVVETAPAIKGATASAQLKPAQLETGLVVQVPPFVANGDRIRVNTETGEYQARV